MITHYFTLKALAQELDIVLRGAIVAQSYSQQKNELIIAVDVAGEESSSLAVSVNPAFNYMYFRQRTSRARKNVVDLFHESIGTKVDRVVVQSHDRVVAFELEGGSTLLFQLYNTAASNILLIDREKNIRDSFKRKGELLGTTLPSGEERFTERVLDDRSTFRQMMRRDSTQQALAALKQTVPVLGTVYAREILFTIGMDEKLTVETLADIDMEKIQDEVKRIVHDIGLPKPRVYFKDRQPVFLSLIPLQHFSSDYTVEEFKQVNDAAAVFVARSFRIEGAEEEKSRLLGKLQDILTRASRSLNATHEQLEKATPAEEYARFGQLIMANIHVLSKGMKEITVDDFFSGNGYVTIALEPHLLPAKNAERYFEKAKKTRIARKESEERLAERTKQVNRLEGLVQELERTETRNDVKEFTTTHRDELIRMKLMTKKTNEPPPPFRIFIVAGGLEVWVGKNSANNDLLTMKYAKPNDLWFHVRGAGGSHTVLKVAGSVPPPKEAIRQAASIAAYYSKMRKAGTVPVAYCERKYVRKPKGLKEGAVVIEREEMVFVKPRLP